MAYYVVTSPVCLWFLLMEQYYLFREGLNQALAQTHSNTPKLDCSSAMKPDVQQSSFFELMIRVFSD